MRRLTLALVAVAVSLPTLAAAQTKVVIDAGHGGKDPGGTGNGMQEKSVVLDVCKRFRDLLRADTADAGGGGEWSVSMTRTDDTFVGLSARAAFANNKGADRFISIHSNAFSDPSANGTETFSYAEGTTSAQLRNLIQDEMLKAWKLRDRGSKTANFAVLRETAMPATLSEMAFITNATESQLLGDPDERQKMAVAHLFALQRHYNLAPYEPGAGGGEEIGSIAGRLVEGDSPVAGALVTLGDDQETTMSDDDGRFSFADLAPGKLSLAVDAAGYQPATAEVDVAAGQAADLEIELVRLNGDEGGDGGGDPGDPGGDLEGGCRIGNRGGAGGGAALLLLLAALVARRQRPDDGSR